MPGPQGGESRDKQGGGGGWGGVVGVELRKVMGRKDDPGGRNALTRAV